MRCVKRRARLKTSPIGKAEWHAMAAGSLMRWLLMVQCPSYSLSPIGGGVWHERNLDILLDREKLATQKLLTDRPGDFFDQFYDIPPQLTRGKTKVTVRFQSRPGDIAGGVFGLRMMQASAAPAERYESTIIFKEH